MGTFALLLPKCPIWVLLGQNLEKTIVIFETEFVKTQSFMLKEKSKFEANNALLGYFVLEFEANIVIFEISTLNFIKNKFLTIIVNFGIEPNFFKGPGRAFSKGPVLGPIYKVCHSLRKETS